MCGLRALLRDGDFLGGLWYNGPLVSRAPRPDLLPVQACRIGHPIHVRLVGQNYYQEYFDDSITTTALGYVAF